MNNKRTASEQQTNNKRTHYKNDKNDKNDKNSATHTPTIFELSSFIKENNLNVDAQKFLDHYNNNGWKTAKGNPVTDWQATVKNWDKLELNKPQTNSVWSNIKKLGEDD